MSVKCAAGRLPYLATECESAPRPANRTGGAKDRDTGVEPAKVRPTSRLWKEVVGMAGPLRVGVGRVLSVPLLVFRLERRATRP